MLVPCVLEIAIAVLAASQSCDMTRPSSIDVDGGADVDLAGGPAKDLVNSASLVRWECDRLVARHVALLQQGGVFRLVQGLTISGRAVPLYQNLPSWGITRCWPKKF